MDGGDRHGDDRGRAPLFITRFSLSDKTAIGVATRRLLEHVPDARHLYWETVDLSGRSAREWPLEAPLAARLAILKRPGLPGRIAGAIGLRWWQRDDVVPPRLGAMLRDLAARTSIVYLAPLSRGDAARMRALAELLDRPFVLHLWDLLDGGPDEVADLAWLAAHARQVYPLNREIAEAVGRPDAALLPFSRPDTPHRASPPRDGQPIRVALLGDVASYRDGLDDLVAAHRRLAADGLHVSLVYVGSPGLLRAVRGEAIRPLLRPTGFLPGDDTRDAALAGCHLAFLPGPRRAPDADFRSRWSIPSRTLDLGAVGLPVAGVVHPRSATARFAPELAATMCAPGPEALAATIRGWRDPDAWRAAADASRRYFNRVTAMRPAHLLARDLARMGRHDDARATGDVRV